MQESLYFDHKKAQNYKISVRLVQNHHFIIVRRNRNYMVRIARRVKIFFKLKNAYAIK